MLSPTNLSTVRQATQSALSLPSNSFQSAIKFIGKTIDFHANEEIYVEDDPADNFYQVIRGMVRSYKLLDDGRRQIAAFCFPGDLFGLEAGHSYMSSTEAIVDSKIMMINRNSFVALAASDTAIAHQLWALTATELHRVQDHATLFVMNAQERVISFLHEMAKRSSAGNEIDLPMTRGDIADYLGLTIETVSRTLKQLERSAWIALPRSRHIVLRDGIGVA